MTQPQLDQASFERLTEDTLIAIEEAIEETGVDIDCEQASGLITLTCEDTGSQIVISRQVAMKQIWVAAKSGGFHFNYNGEEWVSTATNETLQALLSRVCSEQSGASVALDWRV